jgi:23S rRNA (uracil-5-)-methyltransferase RumA
MKIKIDELNINGEGISHIGDKKYCLSNVLDGEVVDADIVKEKGNFVEARVNKILQPSSLRVVPKCPWCQKCGGCNLMFVEPENALELKKQIVEKYFSSLFSGKIIAHSSPNNFYYRNKVSFAVNGNKIGLQKRNSNEIVEVDKCMIAKKEINVVLKIVREFLQKNLDSTINHLVVRVIEQDVCVVLVCKFSPKNIELCARSLQEHFGEHYGLFLNFNTSKDKILSDRWRFVGGKNVFCDESFGIKFFVKPHSFLQVNDEVRDELYSTVSKEIDGGVVVEGYSGGGLLSAIMAKTSSQVFGVEIDKSATDDAERMKRENKIENLTNLNGDCAELLPKLIAENANATFVVDPPRSGVSQKILDSVLKSKLERIVYISCNPYTLRQNINYLTGQFEIEKFEIFDIFPQTFDIESLVCLKRKQKLF